MANSYGPKGIITDGLVFSADAGNAQCYIDGSATGKDLARGNTLTCTNTALSTEGNGSWDFDGTDDFVSGPSLADLGMGSTNLMTCMFWFKSDGVPVGGSDGWVGCSNSTSWATGFGFIYYSGVRFFVDRYNTNYALGAMSTSDAQNWNHYAGVYDGTLGSANQKIYINGVLGGTTGNYTSNLDGTTTGIEIGRIQPSNAYQGDGWYTNVLLYNRAFTQAEITQNYNAQKSRFGL